MKFNIKQSQEAAEKQEQKNASKVTVTPANNESKKSVSTKSSNGELEFNKQHRESYETLMKESSTQLDGYWDSKNPFVKLFLLGLGAVAVLGVIYYVMMYMATK